MNRAALDEGERRHEGKAAFEELSRLGISFGWCLLAVAVLLALAVLFL